MLGTQCLSGRIGDEATPRDRVSARTEDRNDRSKATDWPFTTDDAWTKLRRLYPQVQME